MSIVEKALKKMQEGAPPARSVESPRPFGKIVECPAQESVHATTRVLAINQSSLRATGLMPPEHQERQLAQQYRQIKRPLIANAIGRNVARLDHGQLIMVASAMPGEGKTFTSINLALSMAREKDMRVLLIDADLPKPHLSRLFGVASERGLLDTLVDASINPESLIFPTDIPGLSFMAAGSRSDNTTELLASVRMREVANVLTRNDPYRVVIFDSAPLLLATESQALAGTVGQVVVVVRAASTSHEVVLDALSHLADHPAVSLVLNQSREAAAGYYYYGYGDADQTSNA
jgi:exopolysaccharide/PEP-CTERM locus tyrosine autokinase